VSAVGETAELVLDGVSKRFGAATAVDRLSLTLAPGEFLSLLGPSGCGKTTSLRMMAGFVLPDEGRIWLRGRDVTDTPPYHRDVGLLFQSYALFPHMTVFDNIAFGPRMRREGKARVRERVGWALDLVRLPGFETRHPRELSGGQQQRVAVARVLAAGASVLLLDEPFSNLDAKLRKAMQEDLRELQQRLGIATIHVTHDQEEAMSMSDRLIIMNGGRLEQEGTPETVYRAPASRFVAEFMGRCNRLTGRLTTEGGPPGMAVLELAGVGRLALPWRGPAAPSATVFVRPEHIAAAAAGGFGDRANVLPGELRRRVFLGSLSILHVTLADGRELVLQEPSLADGGSGPALGTRLDLHLPPAALKPLPE
jgi:ABC-type Fe3+/spermidine/putrescine transport system ATPase subunit